MKTSLMLVFGGVSTEHEVSKMSAKNVYAAINDAKYDVTLVYIDLQGKWWLVNDIEGHHIGRPQIIPVIGQGQFITLPGQNIIKPDVLVPVIHGGDGEDGKIASLCDMLHIPYVGCDAISSAVCWDKHITKSVLAHNGIPVTPYILRTKGDEVSYEHVVDTLGSPFFVKPTRSGSAIGVSKVSDAHEYRTASVEAFKHSGTILIESYLPGKELEVAVLGNPPHQKTSGVGQIIPGEAFYTYEDKYAATSTAGVIPNADISEDLRSEIRDLAHKAYQIVGCRGLARVDFLLDAEGRPHLNEINTFPGFTNISQYPKLWHEQGIKYSELIEQLISLALEK
jgi:D-alanine-D-alanine ligase